MRRWNAYFGQPVAIDELLFKTAHGLIDQSLHARMGAMERAVGFVEASGRAHGVLAGHRGRRGR